MNSFLTEWGKDLKTIPVGPLGIIAMAGCEEMGKKINGWLQKWNSIQETQDPDLITMPGVNKGGALKWLCTQLGADESDAYGFGDSLNDLSMMQACRTGIAMGNSERELKELADYVTTDLHEDGIWNAMKHFGII